MLSRGATTEIDGALSNPAGLAFLPTDGFHMSLSIQSAFQTRNERHHRREQPEKARGFRAAVEQHSERAGKNEKCGRRAEREKKRFPEHLPFFDYATSSDAASIIAKAGAVAVAG